jgi:hypothetical protein
MLVSDFAKIFRSLQTCNIICSHALTLSSPLAEKGRSSSLMNSNLSRELLYRLHEFKDEAKKLSRTPRRSQMLAVAKAIDRCLRRLRSRALRDPKASLVHGFTLLYLLMGVEYLLIAEGFAIDPPADREITSLEKLTYPLERMNIRIALPKTFDGCTDYLMKEMKHHLSFSWSTPIKFYERKGENPPEKS